MPDKEVEDIMLKLLDTFPEKLIDNDAKNEFHKESGNLLRTREKRRKPSSTQQKRGEKQPHPKDGKKSEYV